MIGMSLLPPHSDSGVRRRSRWRRWLIPAALLAATPKCVLCLLAYAGLGAALGLGGPELCGASNDASSHWATWLLVSGAAAVACWLAWRCIERRFTSGSCHAGEDRSHGA